jgi:hypothetical protein
MRVIVVMTGVKSKQMSGKSQKGKKGSGYLGIEMVK